jgi:hypothetical protein
MANELAGKHVAIPATDGFEQSELTEPRKALLAAGASVDIVAPQAGRIRWIDQEVIVDHGLVTSRKRTICRPSAPG